MIVAVAIGVGSLAGVRGFSRAFYGMLLREARTLMAADLSVRGVALFKNSSLQTCDDFESFVAAVNKAVNGDAADEGGAA